MLKRWLGYDANMDYYTILSVVEIHHFLPLHSFGFCICKAGLFELVSVQRYYVQLYSAA